MVEQCTTSSPYDALRSFLGIDAASVTSSKRIPWPEASKRSMNVFSARHQLGPQVLPSAEQTATFMRDLGAVEFLAVGGEEKTMQTIVEKIANWIDYNIKNRISHVMTQERSDQGWRASWPMWTENWLAPDWNGNTQQPEDADDRPRSPTSFVQKPSIKQLSMDTVRELCKMDIDDGGLTLNGRDASLGTRVDRSCRGPTADHADYTEADEGDIAENMEDRMSGAIRAGPNVSAPRNSPALLTSATICDASEARTTCHHTPHHRDFTYMPEPSGSGRPEYEPLSAELSGGNVRDSSLPAPHVESKSRDRSFQRTDPRHGTRSVRFSEPPRPKPIRISHGISGSGIGVQRPPAPAPSLDDLLEIDRLVDKWVESRDQQTVRKHQHDVIVSENLRLQSLIVSALSSVRRTINILSYNPYLTGHEEDTDILRDREDSAVKELRQGEKTLMEAAGLASCIAGL